MPTIATVFQYTWTLNSTSEATKALVSFQDYVLSPSVPAEIGFDFLILSGPEQGSLVVALFGAFFGEMVVYDEVIAPFIVTMPSEGSTANVTEGTWPETLAALAIGPLDTSTLPTPMRDTFYAKSLMTPMGEPLTQDAIEALMDYLANDAFGSDGVRFNAVTLIRMKLRRLFIVLAH